MGHHRRARLAGPLAVAAAVLLAGTGCEATVTDTDVAVTCTVDRGDPHAGAPVPQPRIHRVTASIAPNPVTPGGTVWVDLYLTSRDGMFITGPDTTMAIELPVPEGLTLIGAGVESPEANPGWSVDDAGSLLTVRYAAPVSPPFLSVPRIRLSFTVTRSGAIAVPTYRHLRALRRYQGITETAMCQPDDPATVVGTIAVDG